MYGRRASKSTSAAQIGDPLDGLVDQWFVGGGEGVVEQGAGVDPAGVLAGEERRLVAAGGEAAEVGVEADAGGGVVVLDRVERFDRVDADRQLFGEFAGEALSGGFARLALAAGELP